MSRLELRVFSNEHLDPAAELLAARQRAHRKSEPLLPDRFEDVAAARAEIEAAFQQENASGAIAMQDNHAVGYLLGASSQDERWGPSVWVENAGQAVESPEVMRDLYGFAAEAWLDQGWYRHYVLSPAHDRNLLESWYRLSFGQQHAHAIREVGAETWPPNVRRAEKRDVDAMLRLAPLIAQHQDRSPVFGKAAAQESEDELRAELEEDIQVDRFGILIAESEGDVVGLFEVIPAEEAGMHQGLARPEGAAFLSFAVTPPEARGTGAGLALTQGSFAWAHEKGYEAMVTDWRVTNLLSSRFWPARGFRTTFLRLYRSIP